MTLAKTHVLTELTDLHRELHALHGDRTAVANARRIAIADRVSRTPFNVESAKKSQVFLDVARQLFYFCTDTFAPIEPAAWAVVCARDAEDSRLLQEALSVQANIFCDLENYADAFSALEQALQLADQTPENRREFARTYNNFGKALYSAYFWSDAITALQVAEKAALEIGQNDWASIALCNMALCHLELREYNEGLALIRKAINLSADPKRPEEHAHRVFMEGAFVRLLLSSDKARFPEAKERVMFAKRHAQLSGSARAEISAMGIEALCLAFGGSRDVARELVVSHLTRARAIPAALRSALLTTVHTFEAAGEAAEALSHQREFSLIVKKQLRDKVLKYTQMQLVQKDAEERASRAVEAYNEELRYAYISTSPIYSGSSSESFLLTQAMLAEVEWDKDGTHIFRVADLVRRLALAEGMEKEAADIFGKAARFSDIGMYGMPRSIKLKADRLSPEERYIVEQHPIDGADLISHSSLPYKDIAEDMARYHHEKYDGTGYPNRLKGDSIPPHARMVAIADAFDAMVHDRRYASAKTIDQALEQIASLGGLQFDPHYAKTFLNMIADLRYEHGDNLDAVLGASANESSLSRARAHLTRH